MRGVYEVALLVGAALSAYFVLIDGTGAAVASWAIWAWFAIDYSVRVYVADDRSDYVRRHRIELVAALPLEFFRPLRLLRLLRPIGLLVRATKGLRDVVGLTGARLVAVTGATIVVCGGALFTKIEPNTAPTFGDGVWWAIVTMSTVGYGDISPATTSGRIVAGTLMLTGIGLLGALTGHLAERFTIAASARAQATTGDPEVDHVIERLRQWNRLSPAERRRLAAVIDSLARNTDSPDTSDTPGKS